jgi:hypothetical protein
MAFERLVPSAVRMRVPAGSFARRLRLAATLALAFPLAAVPLSAQSPAGSLERTITVGVLTEKGEVFKGLRTDRFHASFHYNPVQVLLPEDWRFKICRSQTALSQQRIRKGAE